MCRFANERFSAAYAEIETVIPFNRAWSGGTGYFEHAVVPGIAPELAPGQLAKSSTPSGRRIIFIGTRLGPIVIYDRFDGQANATGDVVLTYNSSILFDEGGWLDHPSALNQGEMNLLLGEYGIKNNLGFRIEQVFQFMQRDAWKKKLNEFHAAHSS